ncbi:unnamed protein product [Bursaphelenchus xylophilus]|uniref:(pine wood nematode) hypothetical protein n=1 Tax=Bursaphelenchus xylophilus TaxID=6326 RepID=A0A1I7RK46_BURXY|nr:unnamed protein product [Bursaphelenchus xylophilus]CAG9131515.1 unnamed protein product [Bursaphelenchus xylophilus]
MKPTIDPENGFEFDYFEKLEQEYMCCCRAVHVKQGSLMIGVVSSVLVLYSLLSLLITTTVFTKSEYVQLAVLMFDVLAISCLFHGIRIESHKLLLPYLLYMFNMSSLLLAALCMGIYTFLYPKQTSGYQISSGLFDNPQLDYRAVQVAGLFVMISCLIVMVLALWWMYVVWRCFIYLKTLNNKRDHVEMHEKAKYMPKTYFGDGQH